MLHAKFHKYRYIPWSPFPKSGQNMALSWPKHGLHLVLQLGSSWIIINVLRDAPCQISQFWVYPMVPFSWKWQKYGPFMAKTWSFKLSLPESYSFCPGMFHAKFQSPSIYIDRYFNFQTHSVRHSLRYSVTYPTCRAVNLARGKGHS